MFVSFSYKKLLQCSFYENLKNRCKNRFFRKKFKKVCVLQRRACTQTQNFKRNYLENYNDSEHAVKTKNAPFFMIFPNISFFHMVVNYWTVPLNLSLDKNLKNWCKNRFFRKKFKKVCVLQRRACNKFKISNAIISKTTTIQNMS